MRKCHEEHDNRRLIGVSLIQKLQYYLRGHMPLVCVFRDTMFVPLLYMRFFPLTPLVGIITPDVKIILAVSKSFQ